MRAQLSPHDRHFRNDRASAPHAVLQENFLALRSGADQYDQMVEGHFPSRQQEAVHLVGLTQSLAARYARQFTSCVDDATCRQHIQYSTQADQ